MKKQNDKVIVIVSVILLVIALCVFILSARMHYAYLVGLDKVTFYAKVNVSSSGVGFDLNSTALTFGKVSPGTSSSRNIVIDNRYDFPIIAKISIGGKISEILDYETNVLIEKNESKKIGFMISPSTESELGFYDGYVTVKIVPSS